MNVALSTENQLPPVHNGGTQDVHINGLSNGHHSSATSKHKSSSKDKYRDKDKDYKSSNSSGHKSSSRDKEKHTHSSSSSKDKHRDKHRSDEKHGRSSSSHHHHHDKKKESNDKDKHRSSSSTSHHHHHKSSSKEKHHRHDKEHTSSSSKDKNRHHKSHDKDYEKDHHRRHSSSSSSKHKHSSNELPQESPSMDKTNQNENENEFIKPEPVSQQVPDYSEQNGYNDGNIGFDIKQSAQQINCEMYNSYSNGYKEGYEYKPNIKLEEQNYSITQTNSYDSSYTEFKENAVKSESASGVYNDYNTLKQEGEQYEEHQQQQDLEIPSVYTGSNSVSMEMTTTVASEQEDGDDNDNDDDDDDDIPLSKRKLKIDDDDDDEDEDIPLLARKKVKKESKEKKDKKKKRIKEEDGYSMEKPRKKLKKHTETSSEEITIKNESNTSPVKRGRKAKGEQEEEDVWRWWEEEKREDGVKWTTLEHKGPVFAPPYVRLPKNVRFYYDGKAIELSETTEEAASFYAKMLNHDYCTKQIFNDNFFKDFRKVMNSKEREIIKDFRKCNFEEMNQYFLAESEKRKNATKEEKLAKKQENEALIKEYGVCIIDGHKEKIGNFRLEPPGLFRGRGEHPKMGMIKKRLQAEDISINCGKDSKIPQPPAGHRWREVIHNNTVTWLASWVENIQGQVKYIMLNPSSKLKGEKDHVKYETARRLDKCIESIRNTYRNEWKSKEMRVRQRAVALYFIDKLALRAGNEKDEDQADTVGCCSLRVEHVALHKELHGKEYVVVFDFLGKDSIRYYNEVQVEKRVFKNLEIFMENKKTGDDLFDRLNTQVLNEHLKELMEGLTAKVFRTYNASITLQNQLDLLTKEDMTLPEKLLAYNRANRAVAILCNHQRSVPKSHEKSMETLKEKIRLKNQAIEEFEAEYEDMRKAAKRGSVKEKLMADKKGKQLERLKEQLKKLELQETDRDENKTIALGTSKLNYLDPRISVAWCKKFDVPIEKIFNKTQRNKFMWAIHMADENYRF